MRTDWLRLHYHAPKNAKILSLPSDAARWAWVVALTEGKQQTKPGEWVSESHLRACLGRLARYVPDLIRAGLLDITPGGAVVVHDWNEWQSDQRYDPTAAARQQRHRAATRERQAVSRDRHVDLGRDSQRDDGVTTHPTHSPTYPTGRKNGLEPIAKTLADVGVALGADGKWHGPGEDAE